MIKQIYQIYLKSKGVNTDTRSVTTGEVFFALKGDTFDGNQYAEMALEKGAILAVVDDETVVKSEQYILVKDVLTALQQVASMHRDSFSIPFFGITGTNGKTTTKELLYAVLNKKYKTYATKGNLNNHIGVPLTLLSIQKDAEFAIIEMGANHIGEIAELCAIAKPTHGLITNIGKAHLAGFGSLEGVARAKSELYMYLLQQQGKVFVNGTDEHLMRMSARLLDPVYYCHNQASYPTKYLKSSPYLAYQDPQGKAWETKLIGSYNYNNIAAALTVGDFFGLENNEMNQAIVDYIPSNNRSEIRKINTNTIILDAYNANPSSMQSAINSFADMDSEQKILVIGDMFELGKDAREEHDKIIQLALSTNVDLILTCGELYQATNTKDNRLKKFQDTEKLGPFLQKNNYTNTLLLIKGSRGMKMEKLLNSL